MDASLIDEIYECAFVPEKWPGVLQKFAEIAEAPFGWMMIVGEGRDQFTASSERAIAGLAPLMAAGLPQSSVRFKRACAARHAGFMGELDFYPEFRTDPFYIEHIFSWGGGWVAGTVFELPTAERLLVSLERFSERGPVEPEIIQKLDLLRPHLARSALIAARLGLERARAASEALAAFGFPAIVLGSGGKTLAVNSLAEELSELISWRAQDRIALKDKAANQLLEEAVAAVDREGAGVRSFPLRDADGERIMVAHVAPVRLSARDIFARSAAALILTPATRPDAPPVELVQSLFDLTPAEARVARSLAGGDTVQHIADAAGVSTNTVRAQVRGVLEKMGCSRQADAIALLAGISPLRA